MKTFNFLKCVFSGLLLALIVFFIQKDRGFGLFHCLSDACFTSGLLLAGAGGLLFAASRGVFDLMFYSVHSLFTITFRSEQRISLAEYKAEKQDKRKDFFAPLITGAAFILLSIVFLAVFSFISSTSGNLCVTTSGAWLSRIGCRELAHG